MPKAKQTTNEFDMGDDIPETSHDASNEAPQTDLSEFDPDKDGTTHTNVLSEDEMREMGFDDEADNDVKRRMTTPVGNWEKEDEWEMRTEIKTNDSQPGDINPLGRTVWKFYGPCKERTDQWGNVHQFRATVNMSMDKRYARTRDGDIDLNKNDFATKMLIEAKDLYFAIHGEVIKQRGQLFDMMKYGNFIINTFRGDSGPVVNGLRAKKNNRY